MKFISIIILFSIIYSSIATRPRKREKKFPSLTVRSSNLPLMSSIKSRTLNKSNKFLINPDPFLQSPLLIKPLSKSPPLKSLSRPVADTSSPKDNIKLHGSFPLIDPTQLSSSTKTSEHSPSGVTDIFSPAKRRSSFANKLHLDLSKARVPLSIQVDGFSSRSSLPDTNTSEEILTDFDFNEFEDNAVLADVEEYVPKYSEGQGKRFSSSNAVSPKALQPLRIDNRKKFN